MKKLAWILPVAFLPMAAFAANAPGPDWAFMTPDPNAPAVAQAARAPAQPGVPSIVAAGKVDAVAPCNTCHTPSGMGRPESASLRGLNADYFIRQVKDFASGARGGPLVPAEAQRAVAAVTDAEVQEVVRYYASLTPLRWVRIVESATVPKTIVGRNNERMKLPGNQTEPLGKRIIEFADNPAAIGQMTEPAFTAYVPPGSFAAGETIVKGSKTEECASCHGDGLLGSEDIPRLAGRSPVYIARQLYSFKNELRKGPYAEIMKGIADSLTEDDIIAAAAYVASLNPS
jgi:cytochrome c553